MATSSSSVMKSSLVVMLLLLSVVVASQAHRVSCKNTCKEAISFNGHWVGPGGKAVVEVGKEIKCELYDLKGVKHVGKYECAEDVKTLEFLCVGGCLKAKITEMNVVGSAASAELSYTYPAYSIVLFDIHV